MFLALGCSHHNTKLLEREQVALNEVQVRSLLHDLKSLPAVNEAIALSTCNRTEIYLHAEESESIKQWLTNAWPEINYYCHEQLAAIEHVLQVATGVDSMVQGEPQILGQLKRAFMLAQAEKSLGRELIYLFQAIFSASKQVRTSTGIGVSPVSVAYMAVQLAKRIFSDLDNSQVLLIGAGRTVELVARHLYGQGVRRLVLASRNQARGESVAKKIHARWVPISDVPVYLKSSDIVVSATASTLPLLGKGMIESVLKARKHRPLLLLDLAVPRDIEPEASELSDVFLYNVDDLEEIIRDNLQAKYQAGEQAKALIHVEASHIFKEWKALDAGLVIQAYRVRVQAMQQACLEKAKAKLAQGENIEVVLEQFAHDFANKIMHHPSVQLRKAAYDGYSELLLLARELWEL